MMDCSMPVKDGFDATIEIREAHHQRGFDQPVIVACTGHCEPEFIEKAWQSKMDELVPKPLKQKVVAEILHELVISWFCSKKYYKQKPFHWQVSHFIKWSIWLAFKLEANSALGKRPTPIQTQEPAGQYLHCENDLADYWADYNIIF